MKLKNFWIELKNDPEKQQNIKTRAIIAFAAISVASTVLAQYGIIGNRSG